MTKTISAGILERFKEAGMSYVSASALRQWFEDLDAEDMDLTVKQEVSNQFINSKTEQLKEMLAVIELERLRVIDWNEGSQKLGVIKDLIDNLLRKEVEDGMTHPLQQILENFLTINKEKGFEWFKNYLDALMLDAQTMSYLDMRVYVILRVINRFPEELVGEWALSLVEHCLNDSDNELADLAVSTFDNHREFGLRHVDLLEVFCNESGRPGWLQDCAKSCLAILKPRIDLQKIVKEKLC